MDIKVIGGITIAQELDTAIHPDMPETAIESGWIDFVLSPEEIGRKLESLTAANANTVPQQIPAPQHFGIVVVEKMPHPNACEQEIPLPPRRALLG